eukprot:CAMPEP_0184671704 /NCGR_PEP_ID=MMETSP0308-20130426/85661_1 /TAXON_ID=38269 /ORGANISM="Gloeochaete witrockiana, Strain SAG 46.84" /LENGTH=494 /DNA_ID=CAMNT_0027118885 /DNA_START=41 /DNA_END=1525 /DNA_ORIENTATION=-
MSERMKALAAHLDPKIRQDKSENAHAQSSSKRPSLTITDNRTGKSYEVPIRNGVISGNDIGKIKLPGDESGIRVYDPGYINTASCISRVTFIDGDKGILEYRGYPIEELAERSTFPEVAFLLMYGELPSKGQLEQWSLRIQKHSQLPINVTDTIKDFRQDAHPMSILISAFSMLSSLHPDANPAFSGPGVYKSDIVRNKQIFRILGKMPAIAAAAHRWRQARSFNDANEHLDYTSNFLYMLDRQGQGDTSSYRPNPRLARALDILFILHADHELNCSTAAMRHLTSSGVDVYSAMAGAIGALYGPLHGGANEAVVRMLEGIGSVDNVPRFIEDVKAKRRLLYGFGHRVYKNYDPRAKIVRRTAEEVFAITGREPLIDVAQALEKAALSDSYFIERKLYPNVDFYSGLIYRAMGFPTEFFPVLFAIPRAAGWLAHWLEQLDDTDQKIVRPQQVYLGAKRRSYVPMEDRTLLSSRPIDAPVSQSSKRYDSGIIAVK